MRIIFDMNAIEIKKLTKTYKLYERNVYDRFADTFLPGKKKRHREFHALKEINLTVKKGEILGIIGRNGAGKSTLLKIISGITQPTSGSVEVNGRVVALLELGAGFNPEYTGRENIYFTCALQGMKKEEIDAVYHEIVDFSELGEFIDVPVKKYSSGMKARLGFATSINMDPEILILDEILAVGDELFKHKCRTFLNLFIEKKNKTILLVSHDLQNIKYICNRALLINRGEIILTGSSKLVTNQYRIVNSLESEEKKEKINQLKKINNDRKIKESWEKKIIENNLHHRLKKSKEYKRVEIINEGIILFSDCSIINPLNQKVDETVWGEKYCITLNLKLTEIINNILINVIIYNSHNSDVSGFKIEKNSNFNGTISIKKDFFTYLNNGIYGLKVESYVNDKLIYSAYDIYVFKVWNESDNLGIVSLFSE